MSSKTTGRQQTSPLTKSPKESSPGKRRPGRPEKYRKEYCEFVISEGKKGNSFEEIASKLNVCVDTVREWRKHPEFSYAYKRAKQEQLNYFMRLGRAGLIGQKTDANGTIVVPNFNVPVWIFWMKARFGWRDDGSSASDDQDQNDLQFDFQNI